MNPYDYINEKDRQIITIDYKRFNEDLEKLLREAEQLGYRRGYGQGGFDAKILDNYANPPN